MDNKATVTLVLDSQCAVNKPRAIKLRVTYQREPRQFSVGGKNKYVADKFEDLNKRLKEYKDEIDAIETKLSIAKEIANGMGANFTFASFKAQYRELALGKKRKNDLSAKKRTTDLAELWEIFKNEAACSEKTKNNYYIAFGWIFRKYKKVSIDQLDVAFFKDLTAFIKKEYRKDRIAAHKKKYGTDPTSIKDIEDASISSYYRGLNAVFTFLFEEDHIDHWETPFGRGRKKIKMVKKVSTGKAIKDDHLQRFVNYTPIDKDRALQEFAWCFYMLSFQCGGMNPIDIYCLKNKDFQLGELRYIRHKTSSTTNHAVETEIEIPALARMIFEKYGNLDPRQPDSYIFPFFDPSMSESQLRNRTDSKNKTVNDGLGIICAELGIPTYKLGGARHSQATFLGDAMGDDDLIESIARRMAHNNKTVTQTHYIKLTKNKKLWIKALLDNLVEGNTYFTADNFFGK